MLPQIQYHKLCMLRHSCIQGKLVGLSYTQDIGLSLNNTLRDNYCMLRPCSPRHSLNKWAQCSQQHKLHMYFRHNEVNIVCKLRHLNIKDNLS